eukprot:1478557-Amphidinium_carterae.1
MDPKWTACCIIQLGESSDSYDARHTKLVLFPQASQSGLANPKSSWTALPASPASACRVPSRSTNKGTLPLHTHQETEP